MVCVFVCAWVCGMCVCVHVLTLACIIFSLDSEDSQGLATALPMATRARRLCKAPPSHQKGDSQVFTGKKYISFSGVCMRACVGAWCVCVCVSECAWVHVLTLACIICFPRL